MEYRYAILLVTIVIFSGCTATDVITKSESSSNRIEPAGEKESWQTVFRLKAGADCPGTVLDDTRGVLCLFTYPAIDDGSQQEIVALKSGADCPGRKFDGFSGVLCLIEFPRGWRPYVYDGRLYYMVELSDS